MVENNKKDEHKEKRLSEREKQSQKSSKMSSHESRGNSIFDFQVHLPVIIVSLSIVVMYNYYKRSLQCIIIIFYSLIKKRETSSKQHLEYKPDFSEEHIGKFTWFFHYQ